MIFKPSRQVIMIWIGHYIIPLRTPVERASTVYLEHVAFFQMSSLVEQILMAGHLSHLLRRFLIYQPIYIWLYGGKVQQILPMMILISRLKLGMVVVISVLWH